MPATPLKPSLARALLLLLAGASAVQAQGVEDPNLTRGQVAFHLNPASQTVTALYEASDRSRLGRPFFLPQIGVAHVPALEPTEARFQELAGTEPTFDLRLGGTTGRFSMDRQVLALGLSYGVRDRLTLGVTVPVVRSRVDALLRSTPEGANVGRSPGQTTPAEVNAFLAEAGSAFGQLQGAVAQACEARGEAHPDCVHGQELARETGEFLSSLGSAYEEEVLFPLAGTPLGSAMASRWENLIDRLAEWEAPGPALLPLALEPLDDESLAAVVVRPAWPGSGFPLETPPALLTLGDVEAHVALALLDQRDADAAWLGTRLRSSVVGTVRVGTAEPDSLRAVAPMNPPHGVGSFELRWVTDLVLSSRFAMMGVLGGGWYGARDIEILAPDPDRIFVPGFTRAAVRWQPGTHLRASLAPRFLFGDVLSVGGRWEGSRREADAFTALSPTGPAAPSPEGPNTVQRLGIEFRYVARDAAVLEAVPFPFEFLLRASRTLRGSGEWAPVERRIEAAVTVLTRR